MHWLQQHFADKLLLVPAVPQVSTDLAVLTWLQTTHGHYVA